MRTNRPCRYFTNRSVPATSKSYLWLYRTGKEGPSIILYDYQETRSGKNAEKFLSGFKGYLQVDGYAGYHKVPNVKLVGCMAHARRKFDEALKVLPSSKRLTSGSKAQWKVSIL
ncbi:IS66 family transposase [Heyndrickxia sporothermodurans]|uniref:IS66 family transposase n=1 Tax=Heyndrickxia sporothermodurans TaxID=46224 RepID=UPI0036D36C70